MADVLPTLRSEASFESAPRLDGKRHRIRLAWNTRELSWVFSLYTVDQVAVAAGIAVRADSVLTASLNGDEIPPGQIVCIDTSGRKVDPDRDAFRTGRCKLIYVTEAEVAGAA